MSESMDGPELADGGDDGSNPGDSGGGGQSSGSAEPKVGKADLGVGDDDGLVAGFDGVEDEQEDADSGGGGGESSGSDGESIADSIEDGLAEVACIGLQGQERKRVRSEMQAVASQFRIGYFGERTVEKYLQKDLDDIPPEYGLLATVIAFGAVALYKRPDGEERVRAAYTTIRDRVSGGGDGGSSGSSEPAPEASSDGGEDETDVTEDDDE